MIRYFTKDCFRRTVIAAALVLAWASPALASADLRTPQHTGITGKIVFEGKPLPGARVHVFLDARGNFRGEGFTCSAPTDQDGSYSVALAPGTYYLVAKLCPVPCPDGDPAIGGYFGYLGANPVTVQEDRVTERNLQVVRRAAVGVEAGGTTDTAVIEGTVTGPGGPVSGAAIHVYTDATRQFRGPDLFGPQGAVPQGTGDKGEFSIELPAGTYYLVASKRKQGDVLGPLQPGDLHGYYDGNPLTFAAGTRTTVTVQLVGKLRDTAPAERSIATQTGIRGTIRDGAGKVPAGVYAFATTDPSFMIGAMPPYRSQPIGPDGSFFIGVPAGGTYYVSARSGYGGPPLPGEWHGFRGVEKPAPVIVEDNRVTAGIDFVVKKME